MGSESLLQKYAYATTDRHHISVDWYMAWKHRGNASRSYHSKKVSAAAYRREKYLQSYRYYDREGRLEICVLASDLFPSPIQLQQLHLGRIFNQNIRLFAWWARKFSNNSV